MSELSRSSFEDSGGRGSWGVHSACYGILASIFLYVVVARYFYPLVVSDRIGVEAGTPHVAGGKVEEVDQRIDPNVADWPELTRLPGIGEAFAKRIVEYRQRQSAGGTQAVFRSPQDLEAVSGIGPKTVERMTPFLKFSQSASAPSE